MMVAEESNAPRLCACSCGGTVSAGSIYRHGHYPRAVKRVKLLCPACGGSFEVFPYEVQTTTYCSKACHVNARRSWKPDNRLKARFLGKMRAERLDGAQAAAGIGMPYTSLRAWFDNPDRLLGQAHLASMAAWLDIAVEDAERLQGGNAKDKKRGLALAAIASCGVPKLPPRCSRRSHAGSRSTGGPPVDLNVAPSCRKWTHKNRGSQAVSDRTDFSRNSSGVYGMWKAKRRQTTPCSRSGWIATCGSALGTGRPNDW